MWRSLFKFRRRCFDDYYDINEAKGLFKNTKGLKSWASGCPEKYPWIGGEERIPPWYEQERDFWVERSSSNVPSVWRREQAPTSGDSSGYPPAPEDPRIQQLEDIAMDLTTRVFVAEATAQRTAEELERANALNDQLIEQLATLSNQSVQVWGGASWRKVPVRNPEMDVHRHDNCRLSGSGKELKLPVM